MHPSRVLWPRWVTEPMSLSNLREVGPNLFVGGMHAPATSPGPGRGHWSLILDLIGQHAAHPEKYAGCPHVMSVSLLDGEPIPMRLLDMFTARAATRREAGTPVLVHCAAGLSRSASVAVGALVAQDRLSWPEARARVAVVGGEDYPMPRTLISVRKWLERRRA